MSARARDLAPRLVEALLVVASLAGAGALLVALTSYEYGLDQGIYAAVSRSVNEGGVPYRDAWDFKPPGVFFAYALARGLFGEGMQAVRVLEALGFASLIGAFALLSRRFVGRAGPGVFGGALAVGVHVWGGYWQTAQPESFGAVLVAWALVLATAEPQSAARRDAARVVAGAAYALAALMKPPLGGGVLVSAAFLALAARGEGWRAAARPVALLAAGSLAALVPVLVYFAAHGALGDLYEALFVFAPGYTALNLEAGNLLVLLFRSVEFLLFRFSLLLPTGLVLLFALPPLAPRERRGAAHVLGVVAIMLAGVALQARFFPYHYAASLALTALLAGWGLWKLLALRRLALGAALLVALLVGMLNAVGPNEAIEGSVFQRVQRLDDGAARNVAKRRVAAWLSTHTGPDDPIYIWGFEPSLYELARRRPASRFVYDAPQRAPWYRERGRALLMQDLRATPPAAILVQRGDVHPGTAGTERDSRADLRRFPALMALLASDYALEATVEDFTIHLRRTRGAAPRPGTEPARDRPDRAATP